MLSRMARVPPVQVDTPTLDPTLDFMRLLWRIEHGLQSRSKQMEATLGITGPQRLVLRIVDRFPGLSAAPLARIVRLHPSTITGIVQRLVHKGLLARTADRADRRRMRLRVRPGAKPFTRRTPTTIEVAVARALARVPAAHVRQARTVLTAIADALERDESA